ncbi:MAG: hypothetical protein IOD12_09310 [Silvanigrellales bacterium]|nr:hypothetical protein [Silvanigrellales bacterium]
MFSLRILAFSASFLLLLPHAPTHSAWADGTLPSSASTPAPTPSPVPALTMSKALWKTLSLDEKLEIMDAYGHEDYVNLRLKEHLGAEQVQRQLKGKRGETFQNAFESMAANTYLHEEFPHATVGKPWFKVLHRLTLKNGELLAFFVGIHQEGCDLPEFSDSVATEAFATPEDALAAGCEFSDVNWSAYGYFDADGSPILVDEAFEWSGY